MTSELSERGLARRQSILDAARTIFVRDGYHNTKLNTVAKEAGCAVGTLYTYFEDREELLTAVLEQVEREMRGSSNRSKESDPAKAISHANRAYLESFRANAKEMALMEQVSQIDARVRQQRTERANGFVRRNTRLLEKLQAQGKISKDDDVEALAMALSSMTSRLAYSIWVDEYFPDTDETLERIATVVDQLWLRTLGLD